MAASRLPLNHGIHSMNTVRASKPGLLSLLAADAFGHARADSHPVEAPSGEYPGSPGHGTLRLQHASRVLARAGFRIGSRLAPQSTLRHAYRLFCTPSPEARRLGAAVTAPRARTSFIASGAERIAVCTWGDPATQPCVVLAHGWSSHALRFLPWIRPLLEAGHAVVAFDQQGHGKSSGREASLGAFRDTLRAVAGRLDRVAAVVAHAHGACATLLALADCALAERAVLIAAPADPSVAALRFARAIGLSDALSARLLEACGEGSETDLGNSRAHVTAPRIGCPALIIHDLDDREVPWTDGECLARHWRDSRLLTTTGLGHHRIVNDRAVIDATLRFLRGDEVGSRVVSSSNLAFGVA